MSQRYHYLELIDHIEDEEVKRIIAALKDECPDDIIPKEQKIELRASGIKIFRFIRPKFRTKDTYPYFMNYSLFKKRVKTVTNNEKEYCACIMCGLSVFQSLDSLLNTLKKKFRNQKAFVVIATINHQYGSLYKTGAIGHYTLFPFSPFDHDKFFTQIGTWERSKYKEIYDI